MEFIFIITAFIILVYMAYPLWLKSFPSEGAFTRKDFSEIPQEITLILLSYNGKLYLEDKVSMLLKDLKHFAAYEMIIIDDCSTDGSRELLERFRDEPDIRIILKPGHKGISHSMNLGVSLAKYNYIVFCDQRQMLSQEILLKLVEPLIHDEIGIVSACISNTDKTGCFSTIRHYENFLKYEESRIGSLMGVYGPLYAMKKSCYVSIPEGIILDDLYLSLKVMGSKKIKFIEECRIFDEHICSLHDYGRIRRYLTGFLQILTDKELLGHMPARQLIMLFWHKYLRLLIPVMLFLCYISTGILSISHPLYLLLFVFLSLLGVVSLTPLISRMKNIFTSFARINILYILAMGEIALRFHRSVRLLQ